MNHHKRNRNDMLIRVRNFGAAHRRLFPENSTAHGAFSLVATEVLQIEALAVAEHMASQSARAARKRDARRQLVDTLGRAARTARVLSVSLPQLAAVAELPAAVGERRRLTIARAFVTAAAPHGAQFTTHGITIERLEELIEAYETAVSEHARRRDELAQTRDRLDASFTRAIQAVKTLDVTVTNTLVDNPVALAAWRRERRPRLRRPRERVA
jgi:hypothetical protein